MNKSTIRTSGYFCLAFAAQFLLLPSCLFAFEVVFTDDGIRIAGQRGPSGVPANSPRAAAGTVRHHAPLPQRSVLPNEAYSPYRGLRQSGFNDERIYMGHNVSRQHSIFSYAHSRSMYTSSRRRPPRRFLSGGHRGIRSTNGARLSTIRSAGRLGSAYGAAAVRGRF